MRPYRYIISGGGTGGHIYPAIAIAQEIRSREPEAKILFIGARDRMEMLKVPQAGFVIKGLWISGFQRRMTLKNFLIPLKLVVSLLQSLYWIKSFDPNVVIGTGGFASGPVLRLAALFGIPTLIQEQNCFAGVTNRLLARNVAKVCVAYRGMEKFFPAEKLLLTGNPVRSDLLGDLPNQAKAQTHYSFADEDGLTVLVLGGSLGSRRINELIASKLDLFSDQNLKVIWQCGTDYIKDYHLYTGPKIKVMAFIENMDMAYAAADIIISRSGALAISELTIVGKPVIFIPSPNVAENHQVKNAQSLLDQGAAIMIEEKELEQDFERHFILLLEDSEKRTSLSQSIKNIAREGATRQIVDQIQRLVP